MRIVRAELHRVFIPFKRNFDHATATRDGAERIYVVLESENGQIGLGEIMPRPYLTGETFDQVFEITGPSHARGIIGQRFEDQQTVVSYLNETLRAADRQLALVGGFEGALIHLAERAFGGFDYGRILGPARSTPKGRCVTIGLVACQKTLRRYALEAKMAKASVVKVKVNGTEDADRIGALQRLLGRLPIRLDANGALSFEAAKDLLASLDRTQIQSIEQPLDAAEPDLADKLKALFADFGVPILADESVCSAVDVETWGKRGGYQLVNIRVGKCGGLIGAQGAIEAARRHGLDIVGGTLVGESGVLDRYGSILLSHTNDMPYMEGLGQPRWLLEGDPTSDRAENSQVMQCYNCITLNKNLLERWKIGTSVHFT